jgi:hypothetical protein
MSTFVMEAKKDGHRTIAGKSNDHGTAARNAEILRRKGWRAYVYRVGGHNESGYWYGYIAGDATAYAIPNPLNLNSL